MIYYYDFTLLISTNFLPVYYFMSALTTLHKKCRGSGQKFALMWVAGFYIVLSLRIKQEETTKIT